MSFGETFRVIGRGVHRNPFLFLFLLGFVLQLVWIFSGEGFQEHLAGRILLEVWVFLLRPFAMVATWVDPYLQNGPQWLDAVVTGALGLLSYLLLDTGYRHLLRRRRISNASTVR